MRRLHEGIRPCNDRPVSNIPDGDDRRVVRVPDNGTNHDYVSQFGDKTTYKCEDCYSANIPEWAKNELKRRLNILAGETTLATGCTCIALRPIGGCVPAGAVGVLQSKDATMIKVDWQTPPLGVQTHHKVRYHAQVGQFGASRLAMPVQAAYSLTVQRALALRPLAVEVRISKIVVHQQPPERDIRLRELECAAASVCGRAAAFRFMECTGSNEY